MKLRIALLLTLLGLLAGCASVPLAPGCMRLGRSGAFCPLPPAALPELSATHLVTVTHDGQTQSFLGRLQIDAQHVRLAGSTLFGTELFTLAYDGRRIDSHAVQGDLHPDLLLAMLELTLAPADVLPPRLHNLTMTVSSAGNQNVRELWESGHLIARVEKTSGAIANATITIRIPPAKLVLQLTPLAANGSGT